MNPETKQVPIVTHDQDAIMTPGVQVEVTPEQADELGLTEETALSEDDAWASNGDIADDSAEGEDHGRAE